MHMKKASENKHLMHFSTVSTNPTTNTTKYINIKRKIPFNIEIGVCTVDPMSEDFNPKPLINYMKDKLDF